MAHKINRVFYNPVENSSRGHSRYPSEISTLQPPTPQEFPLTIVGGGRGRGYGQFLESHIQYIKFILVEFLEKNTHSPPQLCSKMSAPTVTHSLSPVPLQLMSSNQCALDRMRYTSAPQSCRQCQNLLYKSDYCGTAGAVV